MNRQIWYVRTVGLLMPVVSLLLGMTAAGAEVAAKRRITLAPLGDSRTAAISYDSACLQRSTTSFHNWANALHDRKYPCTGNFGLSGATSDKIVAERLNAALATHPTFLTILMGVNDVKNPGFNAGRTMTNITVAANKALAQGVIPILITDPGSTHYNPAQVSFINEVNERIKTYCASTPMTVLFDLASLVSVHRGPAIEFHPGWSNDGVHLSVLGAYRVGMAFADLLDSLGADRPADSGVVTNLVVNAGLEGTGGTVGKGNAGVLPDNFDGGRDNDGCRAVFSVHTRGAGRREIVAELTTAKTNVLAGMRISQVVPVSVLGAGESLEGGVKVEIDGGSVNLAEARVELDLVFKDGFVSTYDFCGTKSTGVLSAEEGKGPALSLTLQTAGISCPAGRELKTIQFRLGAKVMGVGHATLRFREPWCRKRPAQIPPVANEPALPPDDDSIICNHYRPKGFTVDKIRCQNARVPGGMLLFVRDSVTSVELPVQNDLTNPIDAAYTLEQVDRHGKVMHRQAGQLTLTGGSATIIPCKVDTTGLPYGVYSLVLKVSADGKPLVSREYYFGVISKVMIPKSREGDFLYGLDPNYGGILPKSPTPASPGRRARSGQCDLSGWVDASGADILRAGGFGLGPGPLSTNLDDVAVLRKHGLKLLAMAWVPEPEPGITNGFNTKVMDKWLAQVEATARLVPDITYWELGNEPDLGYPGIDRYVQAFEATSRAVKKGNPKAKVMNGGITFFGEKGPPNSRRLIQCVDPGTIDVIAYHAHGPGSQAERVIYEQTRAAAVEFGKGEMPLADTESGMFVGTKRQEDIQSWMVVQKQVYAQSVGLKFLMTFRLHAFRHGDMGYGLLRSDAEPNPAFLAYRTLTGHLKGLRYDAKLPLSQPEAEGYSFVEAGGPRRACVLWANRPVIYNMYLRVQESDRPAEALRVMDLYGNETPVVAGPDGTVCVEVGEVPVYFLWNAVNRDFRASVSRSLLRLPDQAEVIPKVATPVDVTIENPTASAMTATVSVAMSLPTEGTIEPAVQSVVLPAASTRPVRFNVCWIPMDTGVVWPSEWHVFTGVEERDIDLAAFACMPRVLKGISGRTVYSEHGMVRLLPPGELPREKKPGFAFAVIRSDRDQLVKVGCCADWWLELRLNGQVVCSTMDKGNAFMTPLERIIELPLRKGDNLLAAKILGGKGGLSLTVISPLELPGLLDSGRTTGGITLALNVAGRDVARERLALAPVICPPLLRKGETDASREGGAPDCVLEGASVDNFFVKLPEREKWWGGTNDLMARAWLRTDQDGLNLVVEVVDDKDVIGRTVETLSASDFLRLGLTQGAGQAARCDVLDIGRVRDEPVILAGSGGGRWNQGAVLKPESGIRASVTRQGSTTRYTVNVSRGLLGDGVFRLNFRVNDNDEGYLKQCLAWKPGLGERPDASSWQPVILSRQDAAQ